MYVELIKEPPPRREDTGKHSRAAGTVQAAPCKGCLAFPHVLSSSAIFCVLLELLWRSGRWLLATSP